MCYKETPYHARCGCYGSSRFVGEPCIRATTTKSWSAGCWDTVDMGIATLLDSMCGKCEAQIRMAPFISISTAGSEASESSSGSSTPSSYSGSVTSSVGGCSTASSASSVSASGISTCSSTVSNSPYFDAAINGTLRMGVKQSLSPGQVHHSFERSMWTTSLTACVAMDGPRVLRSSSE
ncbi:unnamed protein product [Zymoseptoria tritici ST99CH_1A5]|uniref:Uncharacterized protein n=4 Tax=Zymoseptoria tritici TaxID=1047171 RepID=F9WYU6_ZYMTI|nr:uncharacterized protein MYCGRDRAFT_88936 [Zymoseptoria tritici IPO323]SMQ45287.1 unnamed protein product [Zymoseptoria tritici ST99CH_3D7]SMR41651.1 unnamed protein product [Zymoseptoria tritici ST99CH_1E4]SMR43839.1 unnamed protein product [Zymoseptoria tritici ST99CH_3D1]SMY19000.1 unnamed protein product [Zymoseptoria tritici ST99CH_1A5]EGP90998.1 hypothetical protein MYCGRDRAFT_88936 [Zymoseptoria tritici IPO323]